MEISTVPERHIEQGAALRAECVFCMVLVTLSCPERH